MILSAQSIKKYSLKGLIYPCNERKIDNNGNSSGLGPCGYDLTIAQDLTIHPDEFKLASTIELFNLPNNILAIIHDKSSLARKGIAVQNTVAEPGWTGYLTLEITNHGQGIIQFKKGDAIAQAIFHLLDEPTELPYSGKYQNQKYGPQEAIKEKQK